MKYLLDTNICIYIINGKHQLPLTRLAQCKPGDVGISSITVAELRYGAAKSQAAERNNQALDQFLIPLEVVSFDEQSASFYGAVRANLERSGKPIGPLDTLIAAQALALELTLVTNNTSEFKRIKNLKIENWAR